MYVVRSMVNAAPADRTGLSNQPAQQAGMSTGAKVAYGAVGAVVVYGAAYGAYKAGWLRRIFG